LIVADWAPLEPAMPNLATLDDSSAVLFCNALDRDAEVAAALTRAEPNTKR